MKILGIRIIREETYQNLLRFKEEVEDILRRKLPVVLDRTLKNKNINLSRGLVMVNSSISDSNIKYRSVNAITALHRAIMRGNVLTREK